MAPGPIRRALGAVKDQTTIGLAKVSNTTLMPEIDVAIVKASRHDEFPADERHIREILSLTCYSRAHVSTCVSALSRRLGKTHSWAVALKTLVLIHRLLSEGDPAYEQEIYFATRRGTRMLNMSDFRDRRSDAWDFSAFVRTYALYLDERLDFRMHGRRKRRSSRSRIFEDEEEVVAEKSPRPAAAVTSSSSSSEKVPTPVREMKTERIFVRTQHLQQILDRFLACRPTGTAKNHRIVFVSLNPVVKESFQLYRDLAEIINIFVDRFMELEIRDCNRIHEFFARLSKQFDELDNFYSWCKVAGICRSSEYPEIERITQKKLQIMDEFIREKSALADSKRMREFEPVEVHMEETNPPDEEPDEVDDVVKALPAPDSDTESAQPEESEVEKKEMEPKREEFADFLHLNDDVFSNEEHGNQLALALFDVGNPTTGTAPRWEAFGDDSSDWETALVQTASNLSGQNAELGGGFDMLVLDGMYAQGYAKAANDATHAGGSASSMAVRAPPAQPMLALPAPPVRGATDLVGGGDPFAASMAVTAPAYVQMSDMEKKQHLLTQEQIMWQQYARDGMPGQAGLARLQQPSPPGAYPMGGGF